MGAVIAFIIWINLECCNVYVNLFAYGSEFQQAHHRR